MIEYKFISNNDLKLLESEVNSLAKEGWEVDKMFQLKINYCMCTTVVMKKIDFETLCKITNLTNATNFINDGISYNEMTCDKGPSKSVLDIDKL